MYRVEVQGLKELMADVKRAGGDATPLVRAAVTNSVNRVQSNVRRRAAHRTGTLQRSVLTSVVQLEGTVQVYEKYGIWLEEGTGIYGPKHTKITPKTGKALKFMYGDKRVVVRSIKGMKARPFFKPGVDESESYVNQQFDKVADRLVSELAGRQ